MREIGYPPVGGFFCEELMDGKIAALFVNGELEKSDRILNLVSSCKLIIAVDGGLAHITKLGLIPHAIIGDMDSVDRDDLKYFEEIGVDVRKFPAEKDQTDLELAIQYLIDLGFDRIYLFGATGGRFDHFLGNMYLLTNPDYIGKNIKIITNQYEMFVCKKMESIFGTTGELVSLLPISKNVLGVETQGLKYPLKKEKLNRWESRGISNIMMNDVAVVQYQEGVLLCIHYFKGQ